MPAALMIWGNAAEYPKVVRQPGFLAVHSELGQEEALALKKLPGHGLAAGHVGVRFDPHPAHRNELPGADLVQDAPEELRIVLLHPRELLGRGAGEDEVGVFIHQGDDVGERPGAFADGFPDRPQPGRIDVGMSGGNELMGRRVGRPGQHAGERGTTGTGGTGNVVGVHDVQHALQRPQDLVAAGQVHGQLVHEPAEREDVLLQFPDGLVELGDSDPAKAVDRFVAGRCFVAVGRGGERPVLGQVGVGRGFDVEVNGHAAAQELERDVLVPRRDRLDDGPVGPPGDAFALEARELPAEAQVHQDFHRSARRRSPGLRHFPLQSQPLGAPRPAPGRAVLLGRELVPQGLQCRHGFVRSIPAAQREGQSCAGRPRARCGPAESGPAGLP